MYIINLNRCSFLNHCHVAIPVLRYTRRKAVEQSESVSAQPASFVYKQLYHSETNVLISRFFSDAGQFTKSIVLDNYLTNIVRLTALIMIILKFIKMIFMMLSDQESPKSRTICLSPAKASAPKP